MQRIKEAVEKETKQREIEEKKRGCKETESRKQIKAKEREQNFHSLMH